MTTRKDFIKTAGLLGMAGIIPPAITATPIGKQAMRVASQWADGSRLVVSVSMQFEAGGQPENAESPFPQNMQQGYKDLPAETWYQYGYKEGIPRMLDNWDKHGIKVTSHMVGAAVAKNPALAKEIVQRGHEAAAHGMSWSRQYDMSYEVEKKFIRDGVEAVKQATGATTVGYNANWLRRGENTHDRIGGSPQMVKMTGELLRYMQKHKGVVFKKKEEIAQMILTDKTAIRE